MYINILAVFLLAPVASKGFTIAEAKTSHKALHWLAGIIATIPALALYYLIWHYTGYPEWIGWFVK